MSACLMAACSSSTAIVLAVDGPAVSQLSISVTLPQQGPLLRREGGDASSLTLPGTVVLVLPDVAQPVDIQLSATSLAGEAMTAETTIVTVPHRRVSGSVRLGDAAASDLATASDLAGGTAADFGGPLDLAVSNPDLAVASPDLAPAVLAYDTFTRANQTHWGTATDGQSWGGDGANNGAFTISGNAGAIATPTLSVDAMATLGASVTDAQFLVTASIDDFSLNNIEAALRVQDSRNFYRFLITGGSLTITRVVGGNNTTVATTPFSSSATVAYKIRGQVVGTTFSARAWPASGAEPTTWMVTGTDTTYASGPCGISATQGMANTRYTLFEAFRL